jgi:hypothetical protein
MAAHGWQVVVDKPPLPDVYVYSAPKRELVDVTPLPPPPPGGGTSPDEPSGSSGFSGLRGGAAMCSRSTAQQAGGVERARWSLMVCVSGADPNAGDDKKKYDEERDRKRREALHSYEITTVTSDIK